MWAAFDGDRKVNLYSHLEKAKQYILPTIHVRQLYHWFEHFVQYGDVSAATKRLRLKAARKGERLWKDIDTTLLKQIVDSKPHLFLDEIQEELTRLNGGRKFHASAIWKKLKEEIAYSLQVVVERARQRNDEERESYTKKVIELIFDPALMVFLDETAKDYYAACLRGRVPPCFEHGTGIPHLYVSIL